jgi:hypothetical protein
MKKLVITGILSVALSSSLFAWGGEDDIDNMINTNDTMITLGVKNLDIHDIGLDSGAIFDFKFLKDKDLGEQGAWGVRTGIEAGYGNLDFSDGSGNTNYLEFSYLIGPEYTFENNLRAYGMIKAGYVTFSDVGKNGDGGGIISGIVGVDYPVTKSFTVGVDFLFLDLKYFLF